jgi:DNA-binding NtrC family response regulator
MVVDDEPKIAALLGDYLKSTGYDVEVVTTGSRAVGLLEKERYSAVVSDLWMGGVSGLDVLMAAAEHQPDCEVVMVSAYATAAMHEKMTALGAFSVLDKPLPLRDFGATVAAACASRRLERLGSSEPPEVPDATLARVLIIGGSYNGRAKLAKHLVERNFAVDAAEDLREATEMAVGADYGLVIFWLDGLGPDAAEAVGTIRRASPETTVIALAQPPDGPAAREMLAAGAVCVLRADVTPAEMLAEVMRQSMIFQARRKAAERRAAIRASARPPETALRRSYRQLAKSLGTRRRLALVIAALAVLAALLGVFSGPLSRLVSGAAADASDRARKIDGALDNINRVEGYLRRDEARETR